MFASRFDFAAHCQRARISLIVALFLPGLFSLRLTAADRPNVLLICIDDLRPELACFGASYIHSPHIDKIASRGRAFTRHYVQAPTCGASRYTLLTGKYGSGGNGALFSRASQISKNPEKISPSMPHWFRSNGYTTVSVGKVSHHPGGRGGPNWDDSKKLEMPLSWDRHLLPAGAWKHPRGWMHGLAHGEIRVKAGQMDVFQAKSGDDSIYPDGPSVDEAIGQIEKLSKGEKPFFLAVGILRPHLPFGAPKKYRQIYDDRKLPAIPHPSKPNHRTTWHGSGEFMKYNRWGRNPNSDAEFADEVRKHYAACVSYADASVGRVMKALSESGLDQNTIVVVWGDHGWHLGEHAVWGKHTLFEESLRSPLIVQYPNMPLPGKSTEAIVESVDLFPTLCALAKLPAPEVDGTSLLPWLKKPEQFGHPAVAYHGKAQTIRNDRYRLVQHAGGYVELYDHSTSAGESKNVADQFPQVVKELSAQLGDRLKR